MRVLAIVALGALGVVQAASQTLFNLNFETADQAVNQIVKIGNDPQHVSSVLFGTPLIVTAFGQLNNQPLQFTRIGQLPFGLKGRFI
jgi:hypothetical protein